MEHDEEFSAFARARWPSLVGSAVLLGCPASEAEDLAQVALIKAYGSWPRVRSAESPSAYTYAILINAARDRHRRRRWREISAAEPLHAASADLVDGTTGIDNADVVERALDSLNEQQRQCIVLRYYAHLTDREIAAATDAPIGTVKSRIALALAALGVDPGLVADRAQEGTP